MHSQRECTPIGDYIYKKNPCQDFLISTKSINILAFRQYLTKNQNIVQIILP